jgi:hypothetical protein|nr:MAG TPA: tail protein [Bacteriophage sp.]
MKVKFDSLNKYEVPNMVVCNPGSTYSGGRLSKIVGAVSNTSDEEVVFNFNTTSTLSFRATKIDSDGTPESDYSLMVYRSLQNRRLIFVEDIGYFVITDTNENYENGIRYKDITASSCEIEIQNKSLIYIEDGTYQFTELFEKIVASLPKWTISYIDPLIAERYRTFEDVDTTLNTLAFMLENMQEAYECIFAFDTINRRISVYSQENYVNRTDIHLTCDDLIEALEVSENVDELYTALSVFGEDEITITSVNPIGTTTIYNFDYYLDWMSDALREKVVNWTALVEAFQSEYYESNIRYYDIFEARSDCSYEIDRLNTQLDIYSRCRDNIVAESSTDKISEYNNALESAGGTSITITDSIEEMLAEIDKLIFETQTAKTEKETVLGDYDDELSTANSTIIAIQDAVSIQNYFSQDEYDELYDYIFEGTYTDEYITTTENMTMREKLAQMKELYIRAFKSLTLASEPDQEFTVDTEDFIFIKDFQKWSEQLETGCLINVELDDGDIAELFLTQIQLNWDDKTLALTFGNRFRKVDPQSLFNNVLGKIQRSSNTINYIKEVIYPVKSGKLDELEANLQDVHTLTVSDIISSEDGEVSISSSGYTGKKRISKDTFRPEQMKITSNRIVFTEDAWKTCQMVLGYVQVSDLSTMYGVNAQTIIGELIIGNRLTIKDENGKDIFTIMDDKISVAADKLEEIFDEKLKKLSVRIDGVEFNLEQLGDKLTSLIATVNKHDSKIGNVPDGQNLYSITSALQDADKSHASDIELIKADIVAIKANLGIE